MRADGQKDWIQVGKVDKTFAKSYFEINKKYPDWGDFDKKKEMKKAYCFASVKKPVKKAEKKPDPKYTAMINRVKKHYSKSRGACHQSQTKKNVDRKFRMPAGKK